MPSSILTLIACDELIAIKEAHVDTASGVTIGASLLLWAMWTIVACRFLRPRARTRLWGAVAGLVGGALYLLCVFAPSLLSARQPPAFRVSDVFIVGVLSVLTVKGVTVLGERLRWWPSKAQLLEQIHGTSADPS